jgi:hypothetical protein
MTYHKARQEIAEYLEKLYMEGRLTGDDHRIAVEILQNFIDDGESSNRIKKIAARGLSVINGTGS